MAILEIIANALVVLAYFFNPKLREKQEREKVWFAFHDLEEKLAKALANNDFYMVDRIRHWLKEMREKYTYLKDVK